MKERRKPAAAVLLGKFAKKRWGYDVNKTRFTDEETFRYGPSTGARANTARVGSKAEAGS